MVSYFLITVALARCISLSLMGAVPGLREENCRTTRRTVLAIMRLSTKSTRPCKCCRLYTVLIRMLSAVYEKGSLQDLVREDMLILSDPGSGAR